ncbi:MAG TPA: TonB-dependent receptor [Acidobacteriaceae bacterium]|nr:TonB-dependent receptor [Acidobacteriaceae bacterium]
MNAFVFTRTIKHRHAAAITLLTVLFLLCGTSLAQSTNTLHGTVTDATGGLLQKATVSARDTASGRTVTATTDDQGHFTFSGLAAGLYTVRVTAPGFTAQTKSAVQVSADTSDLTFALTIGSTSENVTVAADPMHSVASALAPLNAKLDETSAQTLITTSFINNFTSPVSDYGELVQMAPSTFTLSSDGVGLGQSKTYFRGFPDGDYDIDFDGIPFYDTNTPTHHSWAFFPAQAVGGINMDRSPGTASTIGPTPFGGSIHLLSRDLSPVDSLRFTFSGGSFNTYLYDAAYDSGPFGPGKKFNTDIDIHHLQSHGYQSLNNQQYNSGDLKLEYRLTDKTTLTGFSEVIWVDANTPNFAATRCQMYGVTSSAYNCYISGTTTLMPYTNAGINFLLTNNSDPNLYLDTRYNYYHVPTDFEYVGVHHDFAKNWLLDIKPYTYDYDNSEKYSNATPITESTTINGSKTYLGMSIAPCNVIVTSKKGVSALPCGVDKYNSYRKYGEISELSNVSKHGVFRTGMWYEWANTNRHQYPSDPLNSWADQALPNFAEKFVTNSYQPFAEYQWHVTSRLDLTPGVKFAYYTIGTQQWADDGKTIGCFVPGTCNPATNSSVNPNAFIANGGSYFASLPSASANFRLRPNMSVYGQFAQGSIVPPSGVFDYKQNTNGTFLGVGALPKQQMNTTYQTGTVLVFKHATFDADYFHIHFDNSYSSTADPTTGEPVFYAQPPSVTQGIEGQSNIQFTHGLGAYLNASYNHAVYVGSESVSCTSGATGCSSSTPTLAVNAPSGMWIAQTPSDVETIGVTYQHGAWDAALFEKRVGLEYQDNGAYHNQGTIDPFSMTNVFVNYTIRSGSRFNGTKLRLSANNLFNEHSITGISYSNGSVANNITANGTTYADPFNGSTAISGQDNISILATRSIMLTVTFGTSSKR